MLSDDSLSDLGSSALVFVGILVLRDWIGVFSGYAVPWWCLVWYGW